MLFYTLPAVTHVHLYFDKTKASQQHTISQNIQVS